jgi:hypothetical protein
MLQVGEVLGAGLRLKSHQHGRSWDAVWRMSLRASAPKPLDSVPLILVDHQLFRRVHEIIEEVLG